MQAKPALLIKDYDDSKLWAALDELDKNRGTANNAWSIYRLYGMIDQLTGILYLIFE